MLIPILLMLQTVPVGQPLEAGVNVEVTRAEQVGKKLTVSYRLSNKGKQAQPVLPPSVVDPSGRKLPQGKPEDARIVAKPVASVLPGDTLDLTVSFDNVTQVIDNIDPKVLNESTWFFVIGGTRVPFRF